MMSAQKGFDLKKLQVAPRWYFVLRKESIICRDVNVDPWFWCDQRGIRRAVKPTGQPN